MPRHGDPSDYLIRREQLENLELETFVHQHNQEAVRRTACLTDRLGFTDMGVHLFCVEPGRDSSEHHFHEQDEEFLYILSGHGTALIGNDEFEVGPGDFMAFPRHSPAHHMHNSGDEDLIYLCGGTRSPIDICNYPRKGLRQYRIDGKREFARDEDITRL